MDSKNNKFPLIMLIPIIGGIALLISGIVSGIAALTTAGIAVLFGGSFLFAAIIVIYAVVSGVRSGTPAATNKEERKGDDLSETNDRAAEKKCGKSNKNDDALAKKNESARKRKRGSRGAKAFGILFVTSFILFLFGGMGLLGSGYTVAGGVIFACGPAMIILSLIVVKIKERVSLSGSKRAGERFARKVGCVTRCMLSSSSGASTVYRVELQVDGMDRTAYSRVPYNNGDMVEVSIIGNSRIVSIIGRAEINLTRGEETSVNIEADSLFDVRKRYDKNNAIENCRNALEETESANYDEAQAMTAARRELIIALDKLKAARGEAENKREENTNNTATAIHAESSTLTKPVIMTGSAAREQSGEFDEREEKNEPQTAEDHRNYGASPLNKRATVSYKGINRKK